VVSGAQLADLESVEADGDTMKKALLIAGVCCAAAIVALAAQNRGFEGGGPVSRLAAALDADHDGTISAAELRSASAALKTLDGNGDGQLSPDELRPAPGGRRDGEPAFGGRRGRGGEGGERGAPAASADDLTDTLMAFDRNADGRLDRAEVPERFQGLFDRADANKDSALTREELKQSASATVQEGAGRGRGEGEREFGRGRGRGGMFDPLMRALDSDRDGSLSDGEIAGAAAALKALDGNQDGELSGEEFRPVPPRGREGRR
jgi:Ca2+-binding EF-hand superfamily protein